MEPRLPEIRAARPPDAGAERPGRPPPDRVLADLRLDLILVHAGIEVPRLVVFPDMVEAEPVEVVQAAAVLRRTVFAGRDAVGMVATARHRLLGGAQEIGRAHV